MTEHATVLSAVVSAIATVIIAGFTVSLVRASNAQNRTTNDALKLARDEFLATHRPKIIVREVYWDPDNPDNIIIMLGNQGSRTANIARLQLEFDRTDPRPIEPDRDMNLKGDWFIERGSFQAVTYPSQKALGWEPSRLG